MQKNNHPKRHSTLLILPLLLLPCILNATEEIEQARLYTPPDPTAEGGIHGYIKSPSAPIRQIIAIPRTRPERAYRGTLGSDRRSFTFEGLPMDRYDLVVFYENSVYEGVRLARDDSSLNSTDLQQIQEIINRSEPFFSVKVIHRIEGQTGRGNQAMAFCTFARDSIAEMYEGPVIRTGLRRTHKLVFLRQVGPGWQVERTRDLYPIWIEMDETEKLRPQHRFHPDLNGIRVTDQLRNIGNLSL